MQLAAALNVPGKVRGHVQTPPDRALTREVDLQGMPMLVETFPIMAKFPTWFPWMRGVKGRKKSTEFFYQLAREAAEENPNESYSRELFTDFVDQYKLTKEEIAGLSGNLFGAGSDTSSSTLVSFILAAVAFPEIQKKAWEELDRVVGHDRSPTFDDQENLPYINAIAAEVLRWRSVAVIGGQPHANIQEDEYNGWKIPAKTWVQANLWAIHRHPRDFPEPDRFNPDRFLKENRLPYPDRKGYSTFGYGRRVCAGQAFAEQGTFISIARLLWSFHIQKGLDANGREVDVDIFAYTNGLNMRPQPFPARFTPRNPTIRAAIEREAKEALVELERYNLPTKFRLSEMDMADRVELK